MKSVRLLYLVFSMYSWASPPVASPHKEETPLVAAAHKQCIQLTPAEDTQKLTKHKKQCVKSVAVTYANIKRK